MDVILHGPPGAGKGTQSDNICEALGITPISTGDLFRALDANSELGKRVQSYTSQGKLVPDSLVMEILGARLEQPDVESGVLFDGFPRTVNQAHELDKWLKARGRKVDAVFSLEISDEESLTRCVYRLTCVKPSCKKNYHLKYSLPKVRRRCEASLTPVFGCMICEADLYMRKDAKPDKVKQRITTYHEETEPMLTVLENDFGFAVYHIDGMKKPDEVTASIDAVLATFSA